MTLVRRRKVVPLPESLDISKSKMAQLPLFDTGGASAGVAAAMSTLVRTRVRKQHDEGPKRDEDGRPLSDETGGPLSALEAHRVVFGKSIRWVGYAWEGGLVACRPCIEAGKVNRVEDQGFRVTVYSTRLDVCGVCVGCGRPVEGEHCLQPLKT